jgi:hypothetical protein
MSELIVAPGGDGFRNPSAADPNSTPAFAGVIWAHDDAGVKAAARP